MPFKLSKFNTVVNPVSDNAHLLTDDELEPVVNEFGSRETAFTFLSSAGKREVTLRTSIIAEIVGALAAPFAAQSSTKGADPFGDILQSGMFYFNIYIKTILILFKQVFDGKLTKAASKKETIAVTRSMTEALVSLIQDYGAQNNKVCRSNSLINQITYRILCCTL